MTREEALQILDTIPTIGEQVDALEMAIKALEQEPCIQPKAKEGHGNLIDKERLEHIKKYIVDNIMRDPDIMFSDDCRNKVDLPSVIASLYECLHIKVMGEPYNYMFHWANKCGALVDDDLFTDRKGE